MKLCMSIWLAASCIILEVECDDLSAKPPKGKPSLLTSYMPAAMQVIAHLTAQMKFERPSTTTSTTTTTTQQPIRDEVTTQGTYHTTPAHGPAIFAPLVPPVPERILPFRNEEILPVIVEVKKEDTLLPIQTNLPIAFYQNLRNPAYVPSNYQPDPEGYFPLIARSSDEELPDISSLPVQNENNFKSNPLEIEPDELSEENLQYLSPNLRDMLRMQRDYKEEVYSKASAIQSIENLYDETGDGKNVGDWLRLRKSPPSQTFIQLILMYDLMSRDAKKQMLNAYNGYTDDMMKDLMETSNGTAVDQLRTLLERMVARGDCKHDFANNRAKEMIEELKKPESKASSEIRYLEPLRFTE